MIVWDNKADCKFLSTPSFIGLAVHLIISHPTAQTQSVCQEFGGRAGLLWGCGGFGFTSQRDAFFFRFLVFGFVLGYRSGEVFIIFALLCYSLEAMLDYCICFSYIKPAFLELN